MSTRHRLKTGPKAKSLATRFRDCIGPTNERGCIIWVGSFWPNGYGRLFISNGRVSIGAHRVAWELANGPIPDGLCVLHDCDNKACINLSHLFLGTNRDNIDDMVAKGRQIKGEDSHLSILTEEIVLRIRALCRSGRYSQRDIASMFGISQAVVSQIKRGVTWKHLPI